MSFYFLFQLFSLDKNCFDKKKALKNIQLFGYWHKDIDLEIGGRWWLFVRNEIFADLTQLTDAMPVT